jgi:hypothetical protein
MLIHSPGEELGGVSALAVLSQKTISSRLVFRN